MAAPKPSTPPNASDLPTLPEPGERVGRLVLRRRIGKGAAGVVFEAEDTGGKGLFAVKFINPDLCKDHEFVQRFQREVKAATKVAHHNIVAVYACGEHRGIPFLVMELASGGTVQQRMRATKRLPWQQALILTAQAARGLAAVHAAGMIHRDIKPANIMLDGAGNAKLADFGMVKSTIGEDGAALTAMGQVVGTPQYMSPEQCRAETLDHRSDIYSLGATLYCLLTGESPYGKAGSAVAMMQAHCISPTPDPRRFDPEIPEPCVWVLNHAMAKDRDERPQTADDLADELEAAAEGRFPDSAMAAGDPHAGGGAMAGGAMAGGAMAGGAMAGGAMAGGARMGGARMGGMDAAGRAPVRRKAAAANQTMQTAILVAGAVAGALAVLVILLLMRK
jgi:serine/threonine-protein kinase